MSTKTETFYMAGTQNTGQYNVLLRTNSGAVGFRLIYGGVRVRVEPASKASSLRLAKVLTKEAGWKQPDESQNRYSKVFDNAPAAIAAVELAVKLLGHFRVRRQMSLWFWRGHITKHFAPMAIVAASDDDLL